MPRKLKIYLDTSVPNAYLDEGQPMRREATWEFWNKFSQYDIYISSLLIDEIKATGDKEKRGKLLDLVKDFKMLSHKSDEIRALAEHYVLRNIVPTKYFADAVHIAVASVNAIDVLASWNFKHIVKLKTKREVNVVNVLLGYEQLEIVEPSML